jgi:hypothetical protein
MRCFLSLIGLHHLTPLNDNESYRFFIQSTENVRLPSERYRYLHLFSQKFVPAMNMGGDCIFLK